MKEIQYINFVAYIAGAVLVAAEVIANPSQFKTTSDEMDLDMIALELEAASSMLYDLIIEDNLHEPAKD